MVLSMVGCGSSGGAAATSADGTESSGTASSKDTGDGDITIGVSIWSSTDVLGAQCKKVIDQAAMESSSVIQQIPR